MLKVEKEDEEVRMKNKFNEIKQIFLRFLIGFTPSQRLSLDLLGPEPDFFEGKIDLCKPKTMFIGYADLTREILLSRLSALK